MSDQILDLRGVACPMNFVRTRLALDKLSPGEVIEVMLDGGEPVESVSESIESDGNQILHKSEVEPGVFRLTIRKSS